MSGEFWMQHEAPPLIAILRGVTPDTAGAIGDALIAAGFGAIEVPLNSPSPFDSIAELQTRCGARARIGAGTVRQVEQIERLAALGASLCLMPHIDAALIRCAIAHDMTPIPGVMTPTEAFAALDAGAHVLKLFPMELIGQAGVRALKAVLPAATRLVGVGGIDAVSISALRTAGCDGFGLGGWLYKPGMSASAVEARAREAVQAWQAAGPGR